MGEDCKVYQVPLPEGD